MKLTPMTSVEFPAYRAFFVEEYAQDLAVTRHITLEAARRDAAQSIDNFLPQGPGSEGGRLWCIVTSDTEETIGYIWVGLNGHVAWIYDFCLLTVWRGKGHGRGAMMLLKQTLSAMGMHEIGLRVASNNPAAKALYEQSGFAVTGYNMSLRLI
ncbi:GNAT family N-acetyltransferase [Atlantibacter hermannii]|uniref:GNAT family N-acetyltransferase n=1 Tax=Atlantibacter hermannii TaxID=565 RepID=UPI0034D7AE20